MQKQQMRKSIFILGTTAVGKTKLSLDICKQFNGEVISCDSKQLYKHANLLTAKSTPQQMNITQHHMVDCLELYQQSYNRNKFFQRVRTITKEIWARGKTPVFIGGTNYYVQPLLFNIQRLGRLDGDHQIAEFNHKQQEKGSKPQSIDNTQQQLNKRQQQINKKQQKFYKKQQKAYKKDPGITRYINSLTKEQSYLKLQQLDPLMARKLQKNDSMRVNSFLQRYLQTNQRPSQQYHPYSYQLNNLNSIVFWVRNSNKQQHKQIVSNRIEKMMGKQGVLEIVGVLMFLDITNGLIQGETKQNMQKRLTMSGIGQSIGYKQFVGFYYDFKHNLLLNHPQNNQKMLQKLRNIFNQKQTSYQKIYQILEQNYEYLKQKLFDNQILIQAKDELIKDTMAYCKRQLTWIRNRIFQKNQNSIKRFYILDLAGQKRIDLPEQNSIAFNLSIQERYNCYIRQRAQNIIKQTLEKGPQQSYLKYQRNEQQFSIDEQKITKDNQQSKSVLQNWQKYYCKQCQQQLNGQNQWKQHLNSKKHQKRLNYLNKKQEIYKWIKIRQQKQQKLKLQGTLVQRTKKQKKIKKINKNK